MSKEEPVAVVVSYQVVCAEGIESPVRTICTMKELPEEGTKLYSEKHVQTLLLKTKELEEMLCWYVEEDEINEGDPENEYWVQGKHKAMKLLGMEIEE